MSTKKIGRSLYFLIAVMFVRSTAMQIIQPITSLYVKSLGLSNFELGLIAAGWGVGCLIFDPIWGVLSDRGLKKKIFLTDCTLRPLVTFLYTAVRGFWALLFLRFSEGTVVCGGGVSSRGLVADASPKRGRGFGLWIATIGLGGLIGSMLGGFLAGIDYSLPFYASAILSMGALFAAFWISEPKNRTHDLQEIEGKDETKVGLRTLFGIRAFTVSSFIIALPFFTMFALRTFLPVYAHESPRLLLSELEIGLVFSVMSVATIPASLLLGELSDRIGRKSLIVFGMLLQCLAFFLLPLASSINQLCFVVVIAAIANAVSPVVMALMIDNVPTSLQGRALGIYGFFEDIGIFLGPLVAGYVYQYYSPISSFYLCSALMLFNAVCTLALLRGVKERQI